MLHAIRKSGRTSNAHGWHPCSVVARQLRFSPCYKIVAALNRMFGRCTTDSVTELKQSCDFVRLLFLITVAAWCSCRTEKLIMKTKFDIMQESLFENETAIAPNRCYRQVWVN